MTDAEMIGAIALAMRSAYYHGGGPTRCAQIALDAIRPEIERRIAEAHNVALEEIASALEKEVNDYVQENWIYDGTTGAWETSNEASREWVSDRDELIERIRALKSKPDVPDAAS